MRIMTVVLAIVSMILSGAAAGQTNTGAADQIRSVLELQKAAWNRADIEGFMATYWNSDSLTFQSGKSRVSGWANVLARYKRTYAPDNMGKLDFTDISITLLALDAAYVLGRYKLDLNGSHSEGIFTLIFKRMKDGWRIIHDHTSS